MNYKVYTALVTPFNEDLSIDYPSLERVIDQQIKDGCDGFVVCGTTGENVTLTKEEKLALFQFVSDYVKDQKHIIAGIGSNDTNESVELLKEVETIPYIDEYMVVVPYYNRPSQEGVYHHFKEISRHTKKPMIIYNVPKRTGIDLDVETLERLIMDCSNIQSLKQASQDLDLVRKIKEKYPNFHIYSGEDGYLLEGLQEGISGVISVCSHIICKEIKEFFDRYQLGDNVEILDDYIKICSKYVFLEASPAPIKYLLFKLGYMKNIVRLPIVPCSDLNTKKLDLFLEKMK